MTAAPYRILSVDPSLRCTGYAVLEERNGKSRCLQYGLIKNGPKLLQSSCLVAVHEKISMVIKECKPDAFAVESVIYVQSYRTAITLGAARGAAIIAARSCGLPIYEYAPKSVKQAVVGRGGAQKQQVAFMIRALIGLTETPPPDAADAIAVGLAHFHARSAALIRKINLPEI
ncbi:MAG: crossover junction endodeoxyribonuclease RuvC [Chthoniobacterales bacterium]